MTYRVPLDRKLFIELFEQNSQSIFDVPILLKYDPVVENPSGTDYIFLRFDHKPTDREKVLIDLALSPVLYTLTI